MAGCNGPVYKTVIRARVREVSATADTMQSISAGRNRQTISFQQTLPSAVAVKPETSVATCAINR